MSVQALQQSLNQVIPEVALIQQPLAELPLSLWLIQPELPSDRLDDEVIRKIWSDTPYWVFCWASGLAMARWLLAHPEVVKGKTVLDFGAGSGVVAIAAAMAGARRVIACDLDPVSLAACTENANLNRVSVELLDDLYACAEPVDVLLAADVLYDQSNRFFLDEFLRFAPEVWVADSRVKNFQHPNYVKTHQAQSTTWPDLDEADEFGLVSFYQGKRPAPTSPL